MESSRLQYIIQFGNREKRGNCLMVTGGKYKRDVVIQVDVNRHSNL